MVNNRTNYSSAQQVALATQVGGYCPKCGDALFYEKRGKSYKSYELAHIYPLNPTPEEVIELQGEEMLSADINSPDNLMPLCTACHSKFDKPRTREEYRELVQIKKGFLRNQEQRLLQKSYQIEDDIQYIVDKLSSIGQHDIESGLEYKPKSIDEKLDESMSVLVRRKIKHNVTDYYPFIRSRLLELERERPNSSELICSQVRSYYLKQKLLNIDPQKIYENIVDWIDTKVTSETSEAAEIVASFFVQNCEVFE